MNHTKNFLLIIFFCLVLFIPITLGETTFGIICAPNFMFNISYETLSNGKINFINGEYIIIDSLSVTFVDNCYKETMYNLTLNYVLDNHGLNGSLIEYKDFELISTEYPSFIKKLSPGETYSFGKVILKINKPCCVTNEPTLLFVMDNQSPVNIRLGLIINKEDIKDYEIFLTPDITKLDRDSFLSEIKIYFRVSPNRLAQLKEINISLPPINIFYNGRNLIAIYDNKEEAYVIDTEVKFIGKSWLYPFDKYITKLNSSDFKLKSESKKIELNEDSFNTYIIYENNQIIISKKRNVLLTYLIGLILIIILTFLLYKHFKSPNTNLNQPSKQLWLFITLCGIYLVSIPLLFNSSSKIFSLGVIPFIISLILILILFLRFKKKKNA